MKEMKKKLAISVFLIMLATVVSARSYRFEAGLTFYDNESSVAVDSLELTNSRQITPLNDEVGNYRFVLKDKEGDIITEGKRSVSFRAVDPPTPNSSTGTSIGFDSRDMTFFNYSRDAVLLEIYEEEEKKTEVELVDIICNIPSSQCSDYCIRQGAEAASCEVEDERIEQENQTKKRDTQRNKECLPRPNIRRLGVAGYNILQEDVCQ